MAHSLHWPTWVTSWASLEDPQHIQVAASWVTPAAACSGALLSCTSFTPCRPGRPVRLGHIGAHTDRPEASWWSTHQSSALALVVTLREIPWDKDRELSNALSCNRMENPVFPATPFLPLHGCSSCACQNLVFVSATWASTLAFCLSLTVKQGSHWEVFLLLIKHVDNVNLFLASYSKYYSTMRVTRQGLKQREEWEGKSSLCILAYPSAKLAALS